MGKLDGKVAIITGAAQGMGAQHARTLIQEGAKVAITDIVEEKGKALAQELGDNAIFIKHDVTNPNDWKNVVETVKEKFGTVTVLVNNAGFTGPQAKLADMKDEDYLRIVNINQHGVFYGSKAVIPDMIEVGGGSIINIASASAYKHIDANPNIIYTAAKHAIFGMTKGTAVEYGKHNIRVNAVNPGIVMTPMVQAALDQEAIDEIATTIPLGRLAEPEDISKVVTFLASDDSAYISGSGLLIDGGLLAH